MYTIGLEEEFFVFDASTRRAVRRLDKRFLARVKQTLGKSVTTEMLQSQIETVTPVCETLSEARAHLSRLRQGLADAARERGLGIAAMGTFPLAFWPEMTPTRKERYGPIMDDLQMIGQRNMMCGLHIHVAVPDLDTRINLMMRLTPYLPVLLALSTSSPFWQGHLTGLTGYRLAAYDELPRTGLPELFRTNQDYDEYIAALVGAGIIPDASYIWWAIRPSVAHPTLELRIADSCTRLEDAIAIAALFRCLVRALDRDRGVNAGFDRVGRAITAENKWHAQRHGIAATFVEPFSRQPITLDQWLADIRTLIGPDIEAFGCGAEIAHLDRIVAEGTSGDRQIAMFKQASAAGRPRLHAIRAVIDWAAAETLATGELASAA
ncbi:carboxylate-amine ligase [Undibacter mobilis]|uniref:Putative glutamate--cysteine ligase 2 n=1 Tax=Undibacter mobilis TaxID=2292256 RepID=A0A371BD55_9BRAD|nr:carboxylate-amine ligase [Undibacter mobilis]RDV05545.1 carboxylate-amine ligase [Undibacter mobilis]